MKKSVLITILFLFPAISTLAQERIDLDKVFSPSKMGLETSVLEAKSDTLINHPDSLARFFTTRLGTGEKIGFQYSLKLADGSDGFVLDEIRVPFFGGTASSNGLSGSSVRLFMWLGENELTDLVNNQPQVQSPNVEIGVSINELRYFSFSMPETQISSDTTLSFMLYATASDTYDWGVSPVFVQQTPTHSHIYMDSVVVDTVVTTLVQTHQEYWSEGDSEVGDLIFQIVGESLFPELETDPITTSVISTNPNEKPTDFVIQNYPNPFNPTTILRAQIPVSANYTIRIYDMNGKVIQTKETFIHAGIWENQFDFSGNSSGTYIIQISGASLFQTHSVTLVK